MNDHIGQELAVGDWIAYGVRYGDSGDLKVGVIQEFSETTLAVRTVCKEYDGRIRVCKRGWLSGPDKTIKLSKDAVPAKWKAIYDVDVLKHLKIYGEKN